MKSVLKLTIFTSIIFLLILGIHFVSISQASSFIGFDSQSRFWAKTDYYSLTQNQDYTLDFADKTDVLKIKSLGQSFLRYDSDNTQANSIVVQNADCEQNPVIGWTSNRYATLSYSTQQKYQGLASLKIQTQDAWASVASANFLVQPSADYEISLAFYDETNIPYNLRIIDMYWLDQNNVIKSQMLGKIYNNYQSWKVYNYKIRAPLQAVQGRIQIYSISGEHIFYLDNLQIIQKVKSQHPIQSIENWGPQVSGNVAQFGFIKTYPDLTEKHTFRINKISPLVEWQVGISYLHPQKVYEERFGFLVPQISGQVITRNLELSSLQVGKTYYAEQNSPHAFYFLGGPSFLGFDSFDSMKMDVGSATTEVDFYLDYWENHPYFLRVIATGHYEDKSLGIRKAGEAKSAYIQFFVGQEEKPVVISRQPSGYKATLSLTEHPDLGTLGGNLATAFGSDNPADPDYGKKGIIGRGLVWTKGVWKKAVSDSISMETPGVLQFYQNLKNQGVEIVPHTPTDVTETTQELITNLLDFVQFGSRTFILHDANLENPHIEGSISESPYYSLKAVGDFGYRYSYWWDVNFAPNELNMLLPDQTSMVTPIFWHPNQIEDPAYPGLPIFWPTINTGGQPEIWLKPANIDKLIAQRGISFTHSYFGSPSEENHVWYKDGSQSKITPAFDQALAYIAQKFQAGELWVSTIEKVGDFMTALENIQMKMKDDGTIILNNQNSQNIKGVTILLYDQKSPWAVFDNQILNVKDGQIIIPDLASGKHYLKLQPTLFADVRASMSSWPYIEALAKAGVTAGCGQNPSIFCSDQEVTRSQMAVFLVRARGLVPYDNPTPTFSDMPKSHPAYKEIEAVFKAGITSGCSYDKKTGERKFCPEQFLTRAQAAVMITKAKGWSGYTPATPTFSDVPKTHWAYSMIERLYQEKVASGISLNPPQFGPELNITRAQIAVWLVRAFNLPLSQTTS